MLFFATWWVEQHLVFVCWQIGMTLASHEIVMQNKKDSKAFFVPFVKVWNDRWVLLCKTFLKYKRFYMILSFIQPTHLTLKTLHVTIESKKCVYAFYWPKSQWENDSLLFENHHQKLPNCTKSNYFEFLLMDHMGKKLGNFTRKLPLSLLH